MSISTLIKTIFTGIVLVGIGNATAKDACAWPWPWVNPEIYNSGNRISGIYVDPFTGRVVVRTDRTRVRESILDLNRSVVDPGSMEFVDEIRVDANGVQWRVRGRQWTSNGTPHGELTRTRINRTGLPGVDQEENDTVLYSHQSNNSGNANQNSRMNRRSGRNFQTGTPSNARSRRVRSTIRSRTSAYNPF